MTLIAKPSRSSPTHGGRLPEAHGVPSRRQLLTELEQRGVRRQRVQMTGLDRRERLVERGRELRGDVQALGGQTRVLQANRELGGARARACDAARPPGEHLEVGVPYPRDVAPVGGAVVED